MPKKKRTSVKYVDHPSSRYDNFMNAFVYLAFTENDEVRSKYRKLVVDRGVQEWKRLKDTMKKLTDEQFKDVLQQYEAHNQLTLADVMNTLANTPAQVQTTSTTPITNNGNIMLLGAPPSSAAFGMLLPPPPSHHTLPTTTITNSSTSSVIVSQSATTPHQQQNEELQTEVNNAEEKLKQIEQQLEDPETTDDIKQDLLERQKEFQRVINDNMAIISTNNKYSRKRSLDDYESAPKQPASKRSKKNGSSSNSSPKISQKSNSSRTLLPQLAPTLPTIQSLPDHIPWSSIPFPFPYFMPQMVIPAATQQNTSPTALVSGKYVTAVEHQEEVIITGSATEDGGTSPDSSKKDQYDS